MAKDKGKKERENDSLEQFGVWVKAGSDGIQEMEAEPIEIDDAVDGDQLYITEEEEDLLNELHTSEEDGEGLGFDSRNDDDFNLDSLGGDDLDEDLDFSDVASIEETIEDSLPDFDDIPEESPLPFEEAVDKLEAQTELLEESSRQLDILEKIESELSTIRSEIKGLKDEISTIRMTPRGEREEQSREISEEEPGAGFFDDSDLDETIALTGDELDNILDGTVLDEEPAEEGEEELQLQPEETLPEDEFQDETDLLSDTPLEPSDAPDLDEPDEDPALSMLTNMNEEEEFIADDGDSLEITIDDQGEADEEEISLDNLLDEDISAEEESQEDLTGESEEGESLEISNADEIEEIVNIDDVEPSGDVEEIDIADMVEPSPDEDLIIEEVDLDDLGIDLSEFSEDSDDLPEPDEQDISEAVEEPQAAEEPDETLFDEGEEVSLDDMDGDIVFEDEGSFSESDEIESVDLSEFSEDSLDAEEIDSLEDIQLDEISLDSISEEGESDSVEPLSNLMEDESAIEFEDASLDDFLDQTDEMEEDDEPLDFPEEEESVEFPLPPSGSDDDTLIDSPDSLVEFDREDFSEETEEAEDEDDFTQIEIPEDGEEFPQEAPAAEGDEIIMEEEIPETEELGIEEDIPEAEEFEIGEEILETEELVIEEEIEEEISEPGDLEIEEEIEIGEDSFDDGDFPFEEKASSHDDETILDEDQSPEDLSEDIEIPEQEKEEEAAGEDPGFDLDESILSLGEEEDEDFLDLDLDLDLDDEPSLDGQPEPEEEKSVEDVSESFSIEIEDGSSDEIELSSDELETVPAEDLSIDEENIDELLDGISLSEDLGDFAPEEMSDDSQESPDEPEALSEPEEIPSLPDISAIRDSDELASLPYDLKEEIKEVLTYMDQLLEALPEDKIQEFARSEHFEVYKKIFTELGIAK